MGLGLDKIKQRLNRKKHTYQDFIMLPHKEWQDCEIQVKVKNLILPKHRPTHRLRH